MTVSNAEPTAIDEAGEATGLRHQIGQAGVAMRDHGGGDSRLPRHQLLQQLGGWYANILLIEILGIDQARCQALARQRDPLIGTVIERATACVERVQLSQRSGE